MNKLTTEHTPDNIIASWLDDHQEELVHTADYIFHHPELAYQETLSSKCLADYLESQGFKITWKTAGIDTSFTAVWGSGKPLLGFLAEYDALAGVGHACGHNLLGTAVAAAACALKADMEATGAAGTIRVYGCPAEEIMSGKIVMNDQESLMTSMLLLPGIHSTATVSATISGRHRTLRTTHSTESVPMPPKLLKRAAVPSTPLNL